MRTIPAALQTHLDGDGTTLCFLLKITAQNGSSFGVTSLDQAVTYDDGNGSLTYSTAIGLDQSSLETTADLSVDNAEAMMLIADTGDFTITDIEAGVLDYADFVVYRVNWASLSDGHYIVQTGTTGAVRNMDGLAGLVELRSLSQNLKQTFIELYSIGCRAVFGSTTGLFPCNFNAAALWQNLGVLTVGAETDRIFTADGTPAAVGPNGALGFAPGLVEWLTGNNAGLTSEVESVSGDIITLRFPTSFDIVDTDTLKIRPDCAKRWTEDCIGNYDNALNFRGEPLIPLGDESSNTVPGAAARIQLPGVQLDPE